MTSLLPPPGRAACALAITAGAWVTAACRGSATAPDAGTAARPLATVHLATTATGRIERGDSVRVLAVRGGDTLVVDDLAVTPAAALEAAPGGWWRLRSAGTISIAARVHDSALAATLGATLAVAEPPTVIFDRVQDGNRDIWRVALDGAGLTRLTTDAGDDQHPTAAAGTVVFTSYRTGHAQLYAIGLDGTNERPLATTSDNLAEPALSADRGKLAYVRDSAGARRLWWAAADRTTASAVATATWTGAVDAAPAWAPDGGRLAYTSTRAGAPAVFLVDASVGAPAPTPARGAEPNPAFVTVEPAWSPDGRQLVVTSTRGGAGDLYIIDLATGITTPLTHAAGTVGQPTWLADGRIVFTAFTAAGSHLRWLDPRSPAVQHDIPTGPGSAAHPATVR